MRALGCWLGMICMLGFGGCAMPRVAPVPMESKAPMERTRTETQTVQAKATERMKPPKKDRPMHITSDRLAYQEQGKVTLFKGNVQVNQEKAWLFTPFLQARTEEGLAFARDGIRLIDHERGVTVTARELDYRENLSNAVIRGDVVVRSHDEQGLPLEIRCGQIEWNNRQEIAVARDLVRVYYKDMTATAEVMSFDQKKNQLILKPATKDAKNLPEVQQAGNTVSGELITLDIKRKIYDVVGSAKAIILPQTKSLKAQE